MGTMPTVVTTEILPAMQPPQLSAATVPSRPSAPLTVSAGGGVRLSRDAARLLAQIGIYGGIPTEAEFANQQAMDRFLESTAQHIIRGKKVPARLSRKFELTADRKALLTRFDEVIRARMRIPAEDRRAVEHPYCVVCNGPADWPRKLACGHSSCLFCIQRYWDSPGNNGLCPCRFKEECKVSPPDDRNVLRSSVDWYEQAYKHYLPPEVRRLTLNDIRGWRDARDFPAPELVGPPEPIDDPREAGPSRKITDNRVGDIPPSGLASIAFERKQRELRCAARDARREPSSVAVVVETFPQLPLAAPPAPAAAVALDVVRPSYLHCDAQVWARAARLWHRPMRVNDFYRCVCRECLRSSNGLYGSGLVVHRFREHLGHNVFGFSFRCPYCDRFSPFIKREWFKHHLSKYHRGQPVVDDADVLSSQLGPVVHDPLFERGPDGFFRPVRPASPVPAGEVGDSAPAAKRRRASQGSESSDVPNGSARSPRPWGSGSSSPASTAPTGDATVANGGARAESPEEGEVVSDDDDDASICGRD
ncbi:hypothetical protein AAVH_12915 [Aphelenchoides avenae]|nr:hypothetical protein AAVH_12915 [Aphelenchus avenae]